MTDPSPSTETNDRSTSFHWKKGIQSWFDIDGITIEFWASGWSGKEQVRIDGELVSERRSFRYTSTHEFSRAGVDYRIHLHCLSLMTGTFRITLVRNGVEIDSDEGSYAASLDKDMLGPDGKIVWKKAWKSMAPVFLVSGLLGAVCGYALASWLL